MNSMRKIIKVEKLFLFHNLLEERKRSNYLIMDHEFLFWEWAQDRIALMLENCERQNWNSAQPSRLSPI